MMKGPAMHRPATRAGLGPALVQGFLACALLQLASCGFSGPRIGPLKVESVEVLQQQSQIPNLDKGTIVLVPVVMVTFSAKMDLGKLAKEGYNISNRTSVCDGASIDFRQLIQGYPGVYDLHKDLYSFRVAGSSRSTSTNSGPISYHLYFDPRQSGFPNFHAYDLIHNPQDVCFRVDGVNEGIPLLSELLAMGIRSDTVVIPKQTLIEAFRRAGLE